MADFISREAAISEILSEPTDAHYPSWYAEKLKQVPAADARPVVRAHYITDELGDSFCSECGEPYLDITKNFCPNCGADMRTDKTAREEKNHA